MANIAKLLKQVQDIAQAKFDGHFTILHFTTNVRVGFRTPCDRMDYENVPAFPTLQMALENAVLWKPEFY